MKSFFSISRENLRQSVGMISPRASLDIKLENEGCITLPKSHIEVSDGKQCLGTQ